MKLTDPLRHRNKHCRDTVGPAPGASNYERWIFFNIPVGIISIIMTLMFIRHDV